MNRILIVGGGSELQPQLRRIAADIETVVLCRTSSLPFVHVPHENQAMVVLNDGCPPERWLAAARCIHSEWEVRAIASFADVDQERAAAIAADLGIPFHAPETVRFVHDKLAMRARLREQRVESVHCAPVPSLAAVERFCQEHGLPVVLKPSRGWASSGISVARSGNELAGAYARTAAASPPLVGPSPPMVERYVEGREFSVEAITNRGRHHVFAVTEKFKDERTRVELGHVVPARIDEAEERLLIGHVRRALTALGVEFGATHTEVILGACGPVIVETHLRDAGDDIPRLVEDATGVDMAELFLRQVTGADLAAFPEFAARADRPRYFAAAAIRYLALDRTATLECIDGWEEVRQQPGVQSAQQLLPDGARLDGLTSSFARLGSVRVRARDADTAIALADRSLARLAVHLRP